jgi:DNA-binding NarL/FixJ family response regulator
MGNDFAIKKQTTIAFANVKEPLFQTLLSALENNPHIKFIGKSDSITDILCCVENWKPDILVVDITTDELEVINEITTATDGPKIVVISGESDTAKILRALKIGAKAYLKIDSAANEILDAVREIFQGQIYLSQPLMEQAIVSYLHKVEPTVNPYDFLTFQEKKVLRLIAYGYTKMDIADKLHLSERIVVSIYDSIFRKLGGTAFGVGYS